MDRALLSFWREKVTSLFSRKQADASARNSAIYAVRLKTVFEVGPYPHSRRHPLKAGSQVKGSKPDCEIS